RRRYQGRGDLLSRLRCELGTTVLRWRLRRVRAATDRAIFVSQALRAEVGLEEKPYEVIPCVASERIFGFDSSLRERTRTELGYAPDDKVLVYSGSLVDYQCFPESVAMFARVRLRDPSLRLLVVTPESDSALALLR